MFSTIKKHRQLFFQCLMTAHTTYHITQARGLVGQTVGTGPESNGMSHLQDLYDISIIQC